MVGFGQVVSRTAIALALATALSSAAQASVIYNLTLTATSDTDGTPLSTVSGTGTITLSTAPNASGITNYGTAPVTFSIDNQQFSGTASSVQFLNGNFYNASFSQEIGTSPSRFSLQTSGVFAFYYANEQQVAGGTITASPAPASTVPEPATLALLLPAAAGLAWRRRRAR